LKEDLRQIWTQPDKSSATLVLDGWIKTALSSGIGHLVKMGRTLAKYRFGILNWYDHPISSGPLEGINNKSKLSNDKLTASEIWLSSNSESWPFIKPSTL
jgi:transposase